MTSKLSVKLYKGNYKWVQNQLRLFAAYEVCGGAGSQEGIQEPWRGNSQAGSLPGPSTTLTCLSCPCRSGHFFQMLHFGYVAHNGSFLDLSEDFVSDAVPGLEVDSMTAVSHRVDGGA